MEVHHLRLAVQLSGTLHPKNKRHTARAMTPTGEIGHSPDVRVAVTKIQAQTSRSVLPVNGGAEPLTPVLASQHNKAAKQRDDATICTVTSAPPPSIIAVTFASHCLEEEQQKDPTTRELCEYLGSGKLPGDDVRARSIILQASQFTLIDGVVYRINPKTNHKCAVVPVQLQQKILRETHAGKYSGHFSGRRLYTTLMTKWWWEGMYSDAERYVRSCPECIIATGTGRKCRPPLHPIPVWRPFQILGIDVMDLPVTKLGNRHVVVIQDLFTKWPLVFPVPDQKASRIARLIAEEVVPFFGVPESLLSDRGANLLSHLVLDLCGMLGIEKLNTPSVRWSC